MRKERGAIVVILLPSKNEFINYLMEINTIFFAIFLLILRRKIKK